MNRADEERRNYSSSDLTPDQASHSDPFHYGKKKYTPDELKSLSKLRAKDSRKYGIGTPLSISVGKSPPRSATDIVSDFRNNRLSTLTVKAASELLAKKSVAKILEDNNIEYSNQGRSIQANVIDGTTIVNVYIIELDDLTFKIRFTRKDLPQKPEKRRIKKKMKVPWKRNRTRV